MKFPDFIIGGFSKCGTSSLILNIGQHPDIQIDVSHTKNESIFWTRSKKFIEEHLDSYKSIYKGKICGEKCAGYCDRKHNMQYIHKYIPNVKFILCMRNPIDKVISHFEMEKRRNRIPHDRELSVAIPKIRNAGRYMHTLKATVLPFIPKENLHFVIMERMKKDLNHEISKIYNFLGADPFKTEIETHILEKEKGQQVGNYSIFYKDNSNYHIWKSSYHLKATEEERENLYNFFKPYNKELFKFLGYEIKEWRV
jgi:hypothetical protein